MGECLSLSPAPGSTGPSWEENRLCEASSARALGCQAGTRTFSVVWLRDKHSPRLPSENEKVHLGIKFCLKNIHMTSEDLSEEQ